MRRQPSLSWTRIVALCGALAIPGPGAGQAQESPATAPAMGPVVVELFTSQGCSSCPPADAMLKELAQRDGVLALALPVDYWDYIGWSDIFASPQFSDRQRRYAGAVGERTIYTPQIVVGGLDRVAGAKPMQVMDHLRKHAALAPQVALSLRREGGRIVVAAHAPRPLPRPVLVQIVRYTPEQTVQIERGENAGRTVSYTNIVTSWQVLGEWTGENDLAVEAALPGDGPVAVILQEQGPGLVLAARVLK